MIERRKKTTTKAAPLPKDYAKLVENVFATNFDAGLKAVAKLTGAEARFGIKGEILSDEIVLTISLMLEGQLAATTVYASADFDPKASVPTAQDLLGACVDAAASLFSQLLDTKSKENLEAVADQTLSSLKNIPYDWTPLEIERHRIFLKVDKANVELDAAADAWLAKHDPALKEMEEAEHEETEALFVTGRPTKPPTRH